MVSPSPRKRRNAPETRARILAAAQRAFSEMGYARAGIRDIAALAEVTSPMLLRYFGSKAGLFEEALASTIRLDELLRAERADFGRRLADILFDPMSDITPMTMIALSATDKEAGPIGARIAEAQAVAPLAAWLGAPDGRARALEIVMASTGLLVYLRQLPLREAKGAERDHIRSWFAAAIQSIVDRADKRAG